MREMNIWDRDLKCSAVFTIVQGMLRRNKLKTRFVRFSKKQFQTFEQWRLVAPTIVFSWSELKR